MPVAAPMSFAGATQRTLNWLWHDKSSGVKFGVGLWAIPTILTGWWGLILGWYVFFGLLLAPYRLVRRGSRKRKREAAMHKQMLQAVNAGKPVATPTRQCPECAEEIRAEARKCKHCQADVSGTSAVSDVPSSSVDQNSGRAVTEIKTDAEFGVESGGLTAAKKPYVPIWVWILVGFLALFIVVGTSGSDSEESDGVNETSEPLSGGSTSSGSLDPEAGEPESEGEESACLDAWKAEKAAVDAGTLDDATLVATAYDCPDLETWEEMRAQVNYGTSPNLITAVCAIEPDSPVCRDANS